MPDDKQKRLNAAVRVAEESLARRFGSPVRLGEPDCLTDQERRNRVLRCPVEEGPHGVPTTVIIKQAAGDGYDPASVDSGAAQGILNDWAGAAFLSSNPDLPRIAPYFYAGDREHGLIVLEDLGTTKSLVEPLLEEDAPHAEAALLMLAERLGQMHSATVGRADQFSQLRKSLGPVQPPRPQISSSMATGLADLFTKIDVAAHGGFVDELSETLESLEHPGDFWAYSHGDPCPDNCAYTGADLRLIDFEFGRFRHALLDGVYGRVMFPTCWCVGRIPDPVWQKMETVYRSALAVNCPAANEDKSFRKAVMEATVFWGLQTLLMNGLGSLDEDHEWGITTTRRRTISRLRSLIQVCEEMDGLPAIHHTAGECLEALLSRWPADCAELALYPAFQKQEDLTKE